MKILKYVLAASLLTLSCSQGFRHSGRSSGLEAGGRSRNTAAWDQTMDDKNNDHPSLRRLESLTWDSVKHQLTWDVSRGEKKGDGYEPRSRDRYEINMDKATMTFNGESRRFSEDEASNVRTLMDFVSKYAVESTVWWESGEGEPVDGKDKPEKPRPGIKQENKETVKAVRVAMNATAE